MATRREITKKYAADYGKSSKNGKGLVLDELVAVTGWFRSNARRALSTARKRKGPANAVVRRPRGRTYGYDTLKVLIGVWRLAGMPSGKYLAATMDLWLPKLEAFGELDTKRLTPAVRVQLMQVSGATIDRLLKPIKDGQTQRAFRDQGRAAAAELDHGPQGRGRTRTGAGVHRGGPGRPLRPDPGRGIR
ncbi:hypothetical protein [Arthrobacter sp. 754]|uniref:hypothetical protein n=1 Tax=Arthrobacter sp. 754 TaxID=3156315 RepID=UPI003391DE8E